MNQEEADQDVVDEVSEEVDSRHVNTECMPTVSPPSPIVLMRCEIVNPGQLSLAITPWVGAMSTSECWNVNRHTARCTSPVSVVWQCNLVSC